MKRFGLIGAAGYIAPRHMKAIRDTGNELTAALDPFDSVGVLDSHFPNTEFFKHFECFERHVRIKSSQNEPLDYVSICSPNHLHDSHIRFALNIGAHAICEKPLVLNPWEVDQLEGLENETGLCIYNILQLRVHPSIIALREKILNGPKDKVYDVDLTYLTSRGSWYYSSWKGHDSQSGGIATNIGVHFFDMLSWIFGEVRQNECHLYELDKAAGYLEFERARVRWFLSINPDMLPQQALDKGMRTFRSIQIDGEAFEFSQGFTDLHTLVYQDILSGKGYRVSDARSAVEIVFALRHMKPLGQVDHSHPYCQKALETPLNRNAQVSQRSYLEKLCRVSHE